MSITCSPFSITIYDTLVSNNFEAYIVGGYIRDALLHRERGDVDIATNALPEDIERLFSHTIPTGKAFGTITVVAPDRSESIEVTTYRSEAGYSNTRHPDEVQYGCSLTEDLSRRDFTINAMAYEIRTATIVDVFQGKKDLQRRLIRTVGQPMQRFSEDSLRLFRACRFSSQLGFQLETSTHQALVMLGPSIDLPSMERMNSELHRIVSSPFPELGLQLLQESQLLHRLGLDSMSPYIQGVADQPQECRLAFLLQSMRHLKELLSVLRFSKKDIQWITSLIEHDLDPRKASFTVKDLKLSGQDILDMGYMGKDIGIIQTTLKKAVLENEVLNDAQMLKTFLKETGL